MRTRARHVGCSAAAFVAVAFTAATLRFRGLALSEDPLSGYIGIQAHTGTVAFRNIRLKRL
jgi:hypothetical protein